MARESKLTKDQLEEMRMDYSAGKTYRDLQNKYGIQKSAIFRYAKNNGWVKFGEIIQSAQNRQTISTVRKAVEYEIEQANKVIGKSKSTMPDKALDILKDYKNKSTDINDITTKINRISDFIDEVKKYESLIDTFIKNAIILNVRNLKELSAIDDVKIRIEGMAKMGATMAHLADLSIDRPRIESGEDTQANTVKIELVRAK